MDHMCAICQLYISQKKLVQAGNFVRASPTFPHFSQIPFPMFKWCLNKEALSADMLRGKLLMYNLCYNARALADTGGRGVQGVRDPPPP